ncbi:MAG: peptidase M15 [Mesorhizobium amorphae]|nr:MAG: peptidase M15 [Mesorhizobium amorphae]
MAGALAACGLALFSQGAQAETRALKLHFIHTGEKAEIVFKRNGRYDQAGLKKINQFLRDWRRNEPTKMDPRLMDLVWEAYKQTGSRNYITVVSAYRSSATNSMLRSRSKGVAKKSQHTLGKAMDFYIPGVKLKTLREIGLKMQGGGVGYYPNSGSPFVHFDVGNVRHWPKMSRRELVALFPNGKTLHVPSDGKPLPGFEQALASYKNRQSAGQLAIASASAGNSGTKRKTLLSVLFGSGEDDEEEMSAASGEGGEEAPRPAAPKAVARAPQKPTVEVGRVEAVEEAAPERPAIQVVPPSQARPAELPRAPEAETPETVIAGLSGRAIPMPLAAPREVDVARAEDTVADAITDAAAETPAVLAEAAPVELAATMTAPGWRPGEAVADASVLTALAESDATRAKAEDLLSPVPTSRPSLARAQTPTEAIAAAMLPAEAIVPGFAPKAEPAPATMASLAPEPSSPLPASVESPAAIERAIVAKAPVPQRGVEADTAFFTDVKTTGKGARPSKRDRKPSAKPQVVAAAPDAARWALRSDTLTTETAGTKAPSFAYNLVRTAPSAVYTDGFQKGGAQVADANRFTGKAVRFLSVARFETN